MGRELESVPGRPAADTRVIEDPLKEKQFIVAGKLTGSQPRECSIEGKRADNRCSQRNKMGRGMSQQSEWIPAPAIHATVHQHARPGDENDEPGIGVPEKARARQNIAQRNEPRTREAGFRTAEPDKDRKPERADRRELVIHRRKIVAGLKNIDVKQAVMSMKESTVQHRHC